MRAANSIAEIPLQIPQKEWSTLTKPPQEHLGAIIIAFVLVLGFIFSMWFNVSHPTAAPSVYPYYDTQKPVPAWSEPTPLEGNR
jgi:hypothetical protein